MSKIHKVLIANRGEIALRVMRTAKDMGIKTVAIYSEADRSSPHVTYADEAVCIGPPPSSESYLQTGKIIDICKKLKVDAIHPGYGFLSENASFAKEVSDNGIIFIGPSPEAIKIMGDKLTAKSAVAGYNVPLVPGTEKAIDDISLAKTKAKSIGYPILIKASAGGGGKGMRVVEKEADFEEQMQRATSEAKSSFGDGSVFIEKFITSPRHIEIQILGDQNGNIIYLFERECSIQRRHQKVIEEAPSIAISDAMRKSMGEAAVAVARACNYHSAGTVEFIVDEKLNFYFLEMNTRLQVEHPVTEQITGIDLVEQQFNIAMQKSLTIEQKDLKINGHSIEVRVYAEDPKNNFLPDIGQLQTYQRPQGPGVRVDDGFEEGMNIPIYYDPMISKLIVFGTHREEARKRMIRAIKDYNITGIETTLGFCQFVMEHKAFISGEFDTNFVNKHFTPSAMKADDTPKAEEIAGVLGAYLFDQNLNKSRSTKTGTQKQSKWKERFK